MNLTKIVPIEAKRIDPDTGREFTFRVAPPVNLLAEESRYGAPIKDPKEFVLHFFWLALLGDYDVHFVNNFEPDIVTIFPLMKEVIGSINVSREKTDSEETNFGGYQYRYSLNVSESLLERDGMSQLFADTLVKEVLQSPATQMVMLWYVNRHYGLTGDVPLSAPDTQSVDVKEPESLGKKDRLFPNSKDINLKSQFAMPKFVADRLNQGIKGINQGVKAADTGNGSSRYRNQDYKVRNREDETVFVFDKQKLAIETVEQFTQKLQRLKDPKVIQTYFALMKWINLKDTPVFVNVPLSEIMSLVLKSQGSSKFNTPQRRDFSDALEYLSDISITVSVIGDKIDPKTGKKKTVLRQKSGVKLFTMEAEYSVKKEFQGMPRESLDKNVHFDKTVINHFSGKILPDNEDMFAQRGNVYFDTLLHLDANKDGRAIILGFSLQTRFNQLTDKDKFMEVDRAYLIDLCDYQQTDQAKPSQATKQLANTLDKLITAGIISKYTGLTNKNEDRVKIYPPRQKALTAES